MAVVATPCQNALTTQMLAAYGFIDDSRQTPCGDSGGGNNQQGRVSSGISSGSYGGIDAHGRVGAGAEAEELSTTRAMDLQLQRQQQRQEEDSRRNAGLWWSFVGGSFAGLCQAAVIIPTDNIKIKLQVRGRTRTRNPHVLSLSNAVQESEISADVHRCAHAELLVLGKRAG